MQKLVASEAVCGDVSTVLPSLSKQKDSFFARDFIALQGWHFFYKHTDKQKSNNFTLLVIGG